MDDNSPTERPQRYVWPRFVLGLVVLGIVLAVFWMSVLVRQVRERRENNPWTYTNHPASIWSTPTQSIGPTPPLTTNAPSSTNSTTLKTSNDPTREQRMAEFRDTLSGGNVEAGRKVFFESPAANCGKCHKAGGPGGDNGPALDGIATRESREFILESVLFPNAVINTNFQTVVVQLKDNRGISGTLASETETNLVLNTPEDGPVPIQKSEIARRWIGVSPMPEGIWQSLSKQELRDVIEFVAMLKPPA